MEEEAIIGTQKRMNSPNTDREGSGLKGKGMTQKGKGRCLRCGSTGYYGGECHLPFHPIPEFGQTTKGGGKNHRPIVLSDSNAQKADDDQTVETIGAVDGIPEEGWEESNTWAEGEMYGDQPENSAGVEDLWLSQWREHGIWMSETCESPRPKAVPIGGRPTYLPDRDIVRLGATAPEYLAIIDSGASWSVVGTEWLSRRTPAGKKGEREKCAQISHRNFRFGNSEVFPSLGRIALNAQVFDKADRPIPFGLKVDAIGWGVPLLISRHIFGLVQDRIDFVTSDISILKGIVLSSKLSPGGHLWLKLQAGVPTVIRNSQISNVFACSSTESNDMEEDEGSGETELSPKKNAVLQKNDILKIHQQLGRIATSSMKHLMSNAKIRFSEQEIRDVIAACGRNRQDGRDGKSLVGKHLPSQLGRAIFADIYYPVGRSRPYPSILFADSMYRFCDGGFIKDPPRYFLVEAFIATWLM